MLEKLPNGTLEWIVYRPEAALLKLFGRELAYNEFAFLHRHQGEELAAFCDDNGGASVVVNEYMCIHCGPLSREIELHPDTKHLPCQNDFSVNQSLATTQT